MANVSVYNMQGQEVGNIDLNDAVFGGLTTARALRRLRPAPRFPAAEESPGDRRAQATQDRVPRELLSGHTAA